MQSLVSVIQGSEINLQPVSGITGESAHIDNKLFNHLSETIGGGIATFKKSQLEWQIKYDEIIYVISGSMYILENGQRHEAGQGDIYFMKEGAKITYGTDGEVTFFYSLYPINWREIKA